MTKWIKVETHIRVHIQQHVARARARNNCHWTGSLPEQVVLPFFLQPTPWTVKPGTGLCDSSEPAAGPPGRGQSSAPRSAVSSLLSLESFRLYRPLILDKVLLKKRSYNKWAMAKREFRLPMRRVQSKVLTRFLCVGLRVVSLSRPPSGISC